MRVPDTHPLARTLALRQPATSAAAAAALAGTRDAAGVEGLVELLLNPESSATACSAALRSLAANGDPLVTDAVVRAVGCAHPSVRVLACQDVSRRGLFAQGAVKLTTVLEADPFWQVRRAAVLTLAADPGDGRWATLHAATDPHWRVRYALVQALVGWGTDDAGRLEVDQRLAAVGNDPRVRRVRDYLAYRRHGVDPPAFADPGPPPGCPFWDRDPAVVARNLHRLGRAGRKAALGVLPAFVNHPDERVRGWVLRALRDDGEPWHWADALGRLGDPREGAVEAIAELVRGIEADRIEAVARFVMTVSDPPPAAAAWALDQVDDAFPASEAADELANLFRSPAAASDAVRRATERLARRTSATPAPAADEPFPAGHPHTRAATLTPEQACWLMDDPTRETSWHVLARASLLARRPLWDIEPETPWRPPAEPADDSTPLALPAVQPVRPRQLGPGGPVVSPLGVSGHYGLPVEGFTRAAEAGVNLFFWEPNYTTLTRFMQRLSVADRRHLHLLAGTFEADGAKVRKDAERALRNLRVERLGVFLVFWVQSWDRVTDDVRETLERLRDEGKVQTFGLSTHSRTLAAEAVRGGWNPVQVRHSAAHRKAEAEVFPVAREYGAGVITFNNTCYGRLLDPADGPAFTPADCYRYTLSHPAVACCFTAPATLDQLGQNLDALRHPDLDSGVRERLLKRGEWMYREDSVFRRTVRAGG